MTSTGSRPDGREEHITPTGWRIVGKEAVSLLAAHAASLPTGRDEDILFTAKFRARPRIGGGSAIPATLTALSTAIARHWPDAPPLTRDRPLFRNPARFHGLRWVPSSSHEGNAWLGDLVWRHPHPVVPGAPCTTQVSLVEQPGFSVITIRITADAGLPSVRGLVGAGQARPAFLSELSRSLRLTFDDHDGDPRTLGKWEIEGFVREVLLSETRDYPVAVLAPFEEGGYATPPAEPAEELLGLAPLYAIDRHDATYALTNSVGDKRLSCYWGALRVYMPEFSCADRPENHPLLVRERLLDPVVRAGLVGHLGRFAARRVRPSVPPDPRATAAVDATPAKHLTPDQPAGAVTFGTVVAAEPNAGDAGDQEPRELPAPADAAPIPPSTLVDWMAPVRLLAPMPQLLQGLGTQLEALAKTIGQLVDANAALRDEIERLRTTNAVRTASTVALERRIGGFERLLGQRFVPPQAGSSVSGDELVTSRAGGSTSEEEDDEEEPPSLVEVLRQAATNHSDALLILDGAERSAAASPYEDVDRLAVILDAMAAVARRRQEGALGTSLKAAFRDLGIDYRGNISASTSEKHRRQYLVQGPDGQTLDCQEHIALGSSYDPRFCLRVYFTSRAPLEPRFVIGYVGRHFDVATTS